MTSHHGPKRPVQENDFRLRGTEVTRLEAFSDVVFGFALTLLVVSLEVPKTFQELMATMRGFVPFAASFAMLAQVWWIHHTFFRRYGLQDALTSTLNLVLLFVVLFYVYPLKFLANGLFAHITGDSSVRLSNGTVENVLSTADTSMLMVIYGLGFAAIFGLFFLLYVHAYRLRDELDLNVLERYDTRTSMLNNGLFVLVAVISILVAVTAPAHLSGLAGFVYFLIPVGMTILGSTRGAGRRKLATTLGNASR